MLHKGIQLIHRYPDGQVGIAVAAAGAGAAVADILILHIATQGLDLLVKGRQQGVQVFGFGFQGHGADQLLILHPGAACTVGAACSGLLSGSTLRHLHVCRAIVNAAITAIIGFRLHILHGRGLCSAACKAQQQAQG